MACQLPKDPEAATQAYMARLSPQAKARSDAYFEGGYWLQLWGFLFGVGVAYSCSPRVFRPPCAIVPSA